MEGAAEGWGGVEAMTVFLCVLVFVSVQCGCLILKLDVLLNFECSGDNMKKY